jgi:fused signal recognition particle receptor
MGLFEQFKDGLSKTRQVFVGKLTELVTGTKPIDEELFEELEEVLIQADIGVETSLRLVEHLRNKARENKLQESHELRQVLEDEIARLLQQGEHTLRLERDRLNVILIVGVNGVGKTTSIGKLAHLLKNKGYKVMLAAADTFRAAAAEQLEIWSRRSGVDLIQHKEGSDPAAVVFDALQAAKARKTDVLLVDTAGRLQTKSNLMEELKKIRRIIEREVPDGPQEVLLVLDATTGQNALSQARLFSEAVDVTGVILTKLDGTAKGGVVLGIQNEYRLPVKLVGIGEKLENMEEFDPVEFSRALFS